MDIKPIKFLTNIKRSQLCWSVFIGNTMKVEKKVQDLRETQKAISFIKEHFTKELAQSLNLIHVMEPLFVRSGTGINDDLNGVERAVSFTIKHDGSQAEIVQSLAKWKRMALSRYGCQRGEGIYTDMRAIRADEALDEIHSIYVDQWDWEQVITAQDRTTDYLKSIVRRIYKAIYTAHTKLSSYKPGLELELPEDIHFIHAQDLATQYPKLSPKEREHELCKEHKAVFLIGVGHRLSDGAPHDGRAPDYDDWSTETSQGYYGLNGDILVWNPVLGTSLELSSMGIRVDKKSLLKQLELAGTLERKSLHYHTMLLEDQLPLSIGGGIGQSRLCMFLLQKAHIAHVQESVWPEDVQPAQNIHKGITIHRIAERLL